MKSLAHAQELIYQLLEGMPSPYQWQSLKAMLELFLRAQGAPLPEHRDLKSASALSRFFTVYTWSVRQIMRHMRQAIREELQRYRPRGRRPHLQVILDMTTLEKRGKFKAFADLMTVLHGKRGGHLVVLPSCWLLAGALEFSRLPRQRSSFSGPTGVDLSPATAAVAQTSLHSQSTGGHRFRQRRVSQRHPPTQTPRYHRGAL